MKLVNGRLSRIAMLMAVLWIAVSGFGVLAQDNTQLVASTDMAVSVRLPAGYVFSTLPANDIYSTIFIWAENSNLLERATQSFYLGGGTPSGNFGMIVVVSPNLWTALNPSSDDALTQLLQAIVDNPAAPLTINQQGSYRLGGLYDAYLLDATSDAIDRRSYVGGFATNGNIALITLNTSPASAFESQISLLESIGETIRVPAEAGASTSGTSLATPTPGQVEDLPTPLPDDTVVADTVFLATADDLLSIVLPENWITHDLLQDENIFAYGESDGAGLSRLAQARPDLVTDTESKLQDTGGLVILYAKADFGLDADETNLTPLMEQLTQNLIAGGFEIVEQPAPLGDDDASGVYVVVRGAEHGFIALVPFGDQIAYITATSAGGDFEQDRDFLMSIVRSVSVPAAEPEPEVTEAPRTGGLGGLGGLQQQATATPTAAGLGGLGGLGGGEATETPTPARH